MNDSSWGPPQAGYWGPSDRGPVQQAAPAGPAYNAQDAQQMYPMPLVPDVPAHGGDQDDDRGAARTGGPLFHDETPSAQQHRAPSWNQQKPQEPMPSAPQPTPAPQKKNAGRDLGAAIGVGVGLGAVIIASLFVVKAVFVGVIAAAVVVGLWELTSRLGERKGIKAPLVPLAVGGASMVIAGYVRGAEGAWVAMALTALAVLAWRMTEPPEGYLKDVTAGVFAAFYIPFLATFVAMMLVGYPPPFAAVQILWNNLVTEGVTTVNLIMDPAEGDEMRRSPISPKEPLLTRMLLTRMAVMVPSIVIVTLGWFIARTSAGVPSPSRRSVIGSPSGSSTG